MAEGLFQSHNWERERFIKTSFSKTDFAHDERNNATTRGAIFCAARLR